MHSVFFLNGDYSAEGVVKRGGPQGSVLGPLLFNLFINDLQLHVTNAKIVCKLFADDDSIHSCWTDVESVYHGFAFTCTRPALYSLGHQCGNSLPPKIKKQIERGLNINLRKILAYK